VTRTNRLALFFLLSALLLSPHSAFAARPAVVHAASGPVAGAPSVDPQVTVFKGIPFAAPPVGDLRWRPPQPVKPWATVLHADHFGASCVQRIVNELLPWTAEFMTHNQVSEDCLFLNIWTPRPATSANLPVVVYIHGGAFSGGAGDIAVYDGTRLAATGLVVVTVNYRLGVFGFLAHPDLTAESDHSSSGNYGLLDQVAALKWIQANIEAFGGDPHRVTIWGQSAGAFSVGDLMASPLAAGVFQRAMADSGLGIAGLPMADLKAAEDAGVKFAALHHATSIKELRAMPAADLLPGPHDGPLGFAPIVDGWFLPATPQQLSDRGVDNDVPVITGYQANDGLLFAGPVHSPEDYNALAQRQYGDLAADFLRLYAATSADQVKEMLALSGRDRERVSMFLWASRRAANHHQPVFTYFFDRAIPWPQHPEFGAFHTGEIPYFFLNLKALDRPWEPTDFAVAKTASSYLAHFAAAGDPNGAALPVWPRIETDKPETMEIGAETQPMQLADKARLEFWIRYFDSTAGKRAPIF
jgi:para-nitrobenzyl esterase